MADIIQKILDAAGCIGGVKDEDKQAKIKVRRVMNDRLSVYFSL